jgi:divalent metal cation (Fe/Co/Zn/Cd) transporter
MEEYIAEPGEPKHATEDERALCDAIEASVLKDKRILRCVDISVLRQASEYHVTLTCAIDRTRTLAEVHQIIAAAEAQLYQTFPHVRRFTIHAEPIDVH